MVLFISYRTPTQARLPNGSIRSMQLSIPTAKIGLVIFSLACLPGLRNPKSASPPLSALHTSTQSHANTNRGFLATNISSEEFVPTFVGTQPSWWFAQTTLLKESVVTFLLSLHQRVCMKSVSITSSKAKKVAYLVTTCTSKDTRHLAFTHAHLSKADLTKMTSIISAEK